jgi:hypothetical protein
LEISIGYPRKIESFSMLDSRLGTIHWPRTRKRYSALNLMYRRTIEKVLSLPTKQRRDFRKRLEYIMTSSSNIGWGYHDELRYDFYDAFPDDE